MPTAKRQKYLDRIAAKQSNIRTKEERQVEYDKVMAKFTELGLSTEYEEIARFDTMAKDWVETGNVYQGIIPLVGLKRDLVYTLTNTKKNEVGVMLKSTEQQTQTQPQNQTSAPPPENKIKRKVKTVAKPPQAQSA